MVALFVLAALQGPDRLPALQGATPVETITVDPDTLLDWRFPVGERMDYSVTWEGIRLGTGSLTACQATGHSHFADLTTGKAHL